MNVVLREDFKKATGKKYLYLDVTDGGKRKKIRLKIYLYAKPKTALETLHNKKVMAIAVQKEAEMKLNAFSEMHGLDHVTGTKTTIIEYFEKFYRSYQKGDIRKVKSAIVQFTEFSAGKDITFKNINENHCNDFADFLNSKLAGDSGRGYFGKFKVMMKRAHADKLTRYDIRTLELTRGFKIDKSAVKKPILNDDEVERLSTAKFVNEEVGRAFFFALYTGIDFQTCKQLTWSMVDGNRLIFDRSKTEGQNYLPLSEKALTMLGKPDNSKQFIFKLGTWEGCVKVVRQAATSVGITKKITWHSARHTFATRLHAKGVDIRTLQVLLGHSDISHTMKYTKVSDDNRRKAVDLL